MGQAPTSDLSDSSLLSEYERVSYWYQMSQFGWTPSELDGVAAINDTYGAELTMARDLEAARPAKDQIVILKVANGGTDLVEDWAPSGTPGEQWTWLQEAWAALQTELAAKLPGYTIQVDALTWVQGESDAIHSDAAADAYETNLTGFLVAVRTLVGTPDLYAQIVKLHADSPFGTATRRDTIRAAQAAVAAADANAVLIDCDDLEMVGAEDPTYHGHYTGDALQQMGARVVADYLAGGWR